MSVLDSIKKRYSVRSYSDIPVNDDDLTYILEAARYSQSAKNLQDWKFVIVRDEKMRRELSQAAKSQKFVAEAPVVIACVGVGTDYIMTCGQYSYSLDVAIAMENMSLAAHERGLGSCWLGAFYEDQVKRLLGIPERNLRVVGLLTIGHPSSTAPEKRRKPLEDIVTYESWK